MKIMKRRKLVSIIAMVLVVVLFSGFVAVPGIVSAITGMPFDVIGRVADPATWGRTDPAQMGFLDLPRVHDGRIWTDKTVRTSTRAGTPTAEPDEFIVTLSALSQAYPQVTGYSIPTDTVFVIDVSGSMRMYNDAGDGRVRIDVLIQALNEAISILLDAHSENRIAVVAYGGGLPGTGLARVEHLLPLGRYIAEAGSNEFFSFISAPTTPYHHLRVNNVGTGSVPRTILVNGSTPTQWGIYEGAMILQNEPQITADVPVWDSDDKPTDTSVTVTRRPNIILMTDGEPTMSWTNYTFAPTPANPLTPGPAGVELLSPTAPGVFFGDGSYGEIGVSTLTVLTAAHRKREILNSYFPSGTVAGVSGQPPPAVGFYTIAFGAQATQAQKDLIRATLDPFGSSLVSSGVHADVVYANIREGMDDDDSLTGDYNYPGIYKQNPWSALETTDPDYWNPNMGNLLRNFAVPTSTVMEVHAARRERMNSYIWDRGKLSITNDASLTALELNYATMFREAENLDQIREVFRDITTSIQRPGIQYTVTNPHDHDEHFDGFLVFSDVLGEYMRVRNVEGIEFNNTFYSRDGFGAAITPTGAVRDGYVDTLYRHMNYGTLPADPLYMPRTAVAEMVALNINAPGFLQRNSIRYYANTNRDWVANYYSSTGAIATPPADAAAIVEVFQMWGNLASADPPQAPPSGTRDLRLITFHVITALRTAEFREIYATAVGGGDMTRRLNKDDQMIRWYIPADLIPIRVPVFDDNNMLTGNVGNPHPIRVSYTVGLDRERVSAGVSDAYLEASRVPGFDNQLYFYANRHTTEGSNVTLAFYEPHPTNPFYNFGVGFDQRGTAKSQNVTQTAQHVLINRLRTYVAANQFDIHWLGNNGRLTLRLDDPPMEPTGDLAIFKTFEGLPTGVNVFDNDTVSPISFLVIGTTAAGVEIFRQTVDFNSTNFIWNAAQNRYECLLSDLPLGNYRVYERGGHVDGFVVNRPGPPQLVSITDAGASVSVSHVNSYTPSPVPPEDWPALTIRKVFHGLTNAEIPSGFQIRITGPGGFNEFMNLSQAIAGMTYRNLTPGNYTFSEVNNNIPGFEMTVTINNQSVSLPYTFSIADTTEHTMFTIDNSYTPTVPPPPPPPPMEQTGYLTIFKIFEGLLAGVNVFDIDTISQISFLIIGTNDAGIEIFRQTVEFNPTSFSWNAVQNRYECLLLGLPLGNYRVYERGGHVDGYVVNRPGPPQLVSITSEGAHVSVSYVNSYTPSPVPPEDWPALTIRKVFHGLTNAEIPSGFQIRITGPGGFNELISANQAITGRTFRNLAPGSYTITEINNNVPGFEMTVTVNNQPVSLPHTFPIADTTGHITFTIDNTYTPTAPPPSPPPPPPTPPPPSPQTGVNRNLIIPIILLVLGTLFVVGAEVFRRKTKG